jgi:two-component system CheB/CheR fusion protein
MKTQNISKLRRQQVPFLKQPTRMYKDRTRDFPIVGIGASAGGLEAMELFLKTCRNIQVCGVVIQHLDPTHVEFYRNYCNAILLWKYYRSLIDLKFT